MDERQLVIKRRIKRFCADIFFTYLFILVYVTLLTYNYYVYGKSFNLVFLDSIKLMLNSGNVWLILKNILGNIILFLPFGFLAPALFSFMRSFSHCFFVSLLISGIIEICQYEFAERIFDVDDIVLNSVGEILGWLIFKLFHKLYILFFEKNV